MPKLYSARIIIKILERDGFSVVSQKGSHVKLAKKLSGQTLTVIVPYHKEVAVGTFSSILKQAQMDRKTFLKLFKK